MNFAQLLTLDPSSFRRRPQTPGLGYSTFYLPSVGGYELLYTNLAAYDLGNLSMPATGGFAYNTCNGGGSGMTYMYWNEIEEQIENYDNYSIETEGAGRPIRHFDFTDNITYPLRTLMPSGGYIFHIVDNLDGTYRHYEAAPTDSLIAPFFDWGGGDAPTIAKLGLTIADSLNNTLYIVNRADHVNSTAQVCLNYTV